MKKVYPIILVAAVPAFVTAQPDLDSLWGIWNDQTQPDTIRLEAMQRIASDGYLFSQPDSAFYFAQLLYDLAEKSGLKDKMAAAKTMQGVSFAIRGDYIKALEHNRRSLKINEEIGDKRGIAANLNNIGMNYMNQGNYPKALDHYQRSVSIKAELGDKDGMASSMNNIGNIYWDQGDHPKALDHFQKSLKIYKETGNKRDIASPLSNLGNIYMDQGDYPQALDHYQKSLEVGEEIGDQNGIAASMNNIGAVYLKLGEHQGSVDKCSAGLLLAEEIGAVSLQRAACKCLYEASKAIGNYSEALKYLEQESALEDSLNETETAKKLQRYEFDKELLADSLRQEEEKHTIELAHQEEVAEKDKTRNMLMGGGLLLLLVAGGLFSRNRYVSRSKKQIQKEKDRSEELLLNILPEEVAEELKDKGEAEAQLIDQVTVLFTDFKGFTALSEKLSPKELVDDLNTCFSEFDRITAKYGIEKIKTIGDAYMAAGGLPTPNDTHAADVIKAALGMRDFVEAGKARKIEAGLPYFEIRIGVHTGPVVAGIVGVKKFQYDIWGDTVNTASRMESSGEVGQMNISEATYELVKDNSEFSFTARGKVEAKGKGELEMYFVDKA